MRPLLISALAAALLSETGCWWRRKAEPPPPPPPKPALPKADASPLPEPPSTLPPPIESPKPAQPADPQETLPQFPPAPPKPETRKPSRANRPPTAKPELEEETQPETPPAPPPLLGEALTPERRAELEQTIDSNLSEVNGVVTQLSKQRLSSQQREALDRVRSLAGQAKSLRAAEPTTAAQLASRAVVLARELLPYPKK